MSISVKKLQVTIGGATSSGFDITLDGSLWRFDIFTLCQSLLAYNTLNFSLHKDPEETINEAKFSVCGELIGKPITLTLQTENIENLSLSTSNDKTADVEFKGVIFAASGSRRDSAYTIDVEARSWEALLDDNANCKSFEEKTLNEIIEDVTTDYSEHLETEIDARFTDAIAYCVQYNETNYQFIQRLARRYGEWLYNDGTKMVFGNLKKCDAVRLAYPSKDIPSYNVQLRMQHTEFKHVASSYNAYDSTVKEGREEMEKPYNDLSDKVYEASQSNFTKATLQNLHSGGFADQDGRESLLNVSTKTQGRGEKAGMLVYSGHTYCSKLKLGSTLTIVDNFITDLFANIKSDVDQDEILITELVHTFSDNETYSNHFVGISAECDYPPYANTDIYPVAPSCRAKVTDNEDPMNLGRVRVQFDWQAQSDESMMTPWLRIAQPYAGGGKGFSFIPEIGEEVMIDFEGGNAERPYVKGTLYNGVGDPDSNWVPNNNSDNPIKAIRTRNGHTIEIHDEGDDGFIRIYDNGKNNYILTFSTDEKLIKLESSGNIELYAKNDIIMEAGNNMNINVGSNRTLDVGNNDDSTIGNDQSIEVGNNQTVQVGNDQETTINRNNIIQIEGDQIIDISGNKEERIVNMCYLSAQDYREEIDNEVLVVSTSQQYKSTSFTKIDGGTQIDIVSATTKIN